jgi:tetratricopeptide (TPR) repeat protein
VASGQPVFDAASQLAKAYLAVGQPRRALKAIDAAIRQAPWDGGLYYRQARIYEALGRPELARVAYTDSRRLMNAGRESVAVLLRCSDLLAKGSLAEAVAAGDELVRQAATDPRALVALGALYAGAGAHQQALAVFTKAADREPSLFQAQYNAGLALLKLGRLADARAPLETAASLLPQSPDVHSALGLLHVMERRYTDAVPHLEKALDWDDASSRVPGVLGLAYLRSGAAEKSVATLRRAVQVAPDDPKTYFALIEALNAVEKQSEALATAGEAARRFPQSADAHLALAQQLAKIGRYQDAGPAFSKAHELAPDRREPMIGLADALEKRGEYEKSLDLYRRAGDRLGVVRTLVALRRFDEARGILEAGVHAAPDDPQLRLELSRVYARLGRKDEAAEQARISQQLRNRAAQ